MLVLVEFHKGLICMFGIFYMYKNKAIDNLFAKLYLCILKKILDVYRSMNGGFEIFLIPFGYFGLVIFLP